MKWILRPVLCVMVVFFFCSNASADSLDEALEPDSGRFSLQKAFDKTDAMIKENVSGSQVAPPREGNYAIFKEANFRLRGDYQINAVYYKERDINGINGSGLYESEYVDWDARENWHKRVMTNEIEAWIYHDLLLNPIIEFGGGLVNLHFELYNGGYMWEASTPNVVDVRDINPAGNYEQSILDYQKIQLRSAFIELITPVGMIMAGQLPPSYGGVTGFMYGIGGLPKIPNLSFALLYGKLGEGTNKYAFEHTAGIYYWMTQNDHNHQDKDDLTMYALNVMYDNRKNFDAVLGLANIRGDSGAWYWMDTDIMAIGGRFNYQRRNLHLTAFLSSRFGDAAPMTRNAAGNQMRIVHKFITAQADQLGYIRYPAEFPIDMVIEPGLAFFTLATYDINNAFSPELGLMYISGGDRWYEGNHSFGREFEPEGNRTPRNYVKAYILNEVEDKYYPLISTPASMGPRETEIQSYQNMSAIKLGATYQLSRSFEIFGQALYAQRTNVNYFKEDYWDFFFMGYGSPRAYYETSENGLRRRVGPTILQLTDVEYHEDDISSHLGTEVNGRLTWFVRRGLELSLIGAYFWPGQFYEDILRPKKYLLAWSKLEDGAESSLPDGPMVPIYGPNISVQVPDPENPDYGMFELADAWTLQFKFDFKFE